MVNPVSAGITAIQLRQNVIVLLFYGNLNAENSDSGDILVTQDKLYSMSLFVEAKQISCGKNLEILIG